MFDFKFNRKNQLKTVQHIIIALTIFSAALHLFDYQQYSTEWHQYYENKLHRNGFDEDMAENLSKIIFNATIIVATMYNIIFILFVVKEILVVVVLFSILELALLISSLIRVKNPNTSVMTGIEFMLWTLQVMVGFRYCYLLKQKINENKKEKNIEVEPCFSV